jgi:hypothetical protein
MTHDIAMVGILVHGDNHFIVRGPLPDREGALALVRHWSLMSDLQLLVRKTSMVETRLLPSDLILFT